MQEERRGGESRQQYWQKEGEGEVVQRLQRDYLDQSKAESASSTRDKGLCDDVDLADDSESRS